MTNVFDNFYSLLFRAKYRSRSHVSSENGITRTAQEMLRHFIITADTRTHFDDLFSVPPSLNEKNVWLNYLFPFSCQYSFVCLYSIDASFTKCFPSVFRWYRDQSISFRWHNRLLVSDRVIVSLTQLSTLTRFSHWESETKRREYFSRNATQFLFKLGCFDYHYCTSFLFQKCGQMGEKWMIADDCLSTRARAAMLDRLAILLENPGMQSHSCQR